MYEISLARKAIRTLARRGRGDNPESISEKGMVSTLLHDFAYGVKNSRGFVPPVPLLTKAPTIY